MKIYTIGFTGKTAEEFFGLLNSAEAKVLVDIRLHNRSQLAGFARRDHMPFFTERLADMCYVELPLLAPDPDAFKHYRKAREWDPFEEGYLRMLSDRGVVDAIDRRLFSGGVVMLCSEPTAEKCHRRLAAEYLKQNLFPEAEIFHL